MTSGVYPVDDSRDDVGGVGGMMDGGEMRATIEARIKYKLIGCGRGKKNRSKTRESEDC